MNTATTARLRLTESIVLIDYSEDDDFGPTDAELSSDAEDWTDIGEWFPSSDDDEEELAHVARAAREHRLMLGWED